MNSGILNCMSLNMKKGFTILELLVVIAIISIISAVILVAVNQSRTKGLDASIKAQLTEARKEAQLYYENRDGKYCVEEGPGDPDCYYGELNGSTSYCTQNFSVFDTDHDPTPYSIGNFIIAAQAYAPQGSQPLCFMDQIGSRWSVAVRLNSVADGWWCVDSEGDAKFLSGTEDDVKNAVNGNSVSQTCP